MPESRSAPKPAPVLLGGDPSPVRALLLQAYESVVTPKGAIYCSAPITSGRRYLEWFGRQRAGRQSIDDLSTAERELHRTQVIEPNQAHAKAVIDRLRLRRNKPVIDPTAIGPIEGWRQDAWIAFWEDVIGQFAFEVVLIDGWEYSYGCTHEFWFAQSRRIPTLHESGKQLAASEGVWRIQAAIAELRQAGADTSKLDRVLELLKDMGR